MHTEAQQAVMTGAEQRHRRNCAARGRPQSGLAICSWSGHEPVVNGDASKHCSIHGELLVLPRLHVTDGNCEPVELGLEGNEVRHARVLACF
jgi:hypothetical protein